MSSSTPPLLLDAATIDAIARRVVELQREAAKIVTPTADVLTLSEAMLYVKRGSKRAFYRWCQRWGVEPRVHGRYSRAVLDRALAREGGAVRRPGSPRD